MTGNERYEGYALEALEMGNLKIFLNIPPEMETKTFANVYVCLDTLYRLHSKRPDLNIPEKFVEAIKGLLKMNDLLDLITAMEYIKTQFENEKTGEANFKLVDQDLLDYFILVTQQNKALFDKIHGYIKDEYGSGMDMANNIIEEYSSRIAR